MQNRVIVIGGLENAYMRKLALYLSNRLEGRSRVAIVGEQGIENMDKAEILWIGSRAFIEQIQMQNGQEDCLILAEEECGEERSVCRYQSSEKIYQRIMFLCQKMRTAALTGAQGMMQKWIVLTTDSAASQLLAFSLTMAGVLRNRGNVLYLNLTACSGMESLLDIDQGVNVSDLALAIRAEQDVGLQAFVRRVEDLDCIFSPDNPSVLYELRGEDVLALMERVQAEQQYVYVVVALGNACCGCEFFFRRAAAVFHLTREGEAFAGCTREWLHYIGLCLKPLQTKIQQIAMPSCRTEENGIHLLYEWREGVLGRMAEKLLDGMISEG